MKWKGLLAGWLLAGAADAFLAPTMARGAGLRFVSPHSNQVVSGDNVLLWAAEAAAPAREAQLKKRRMVFEVSTDNRTFRPLPRQPAPDFGPFSQTSALDATAFPSGPLFLRVRYADQSKGPTIRVRVNKLPEVDCRAVSEIPGSFSVFFNCAGSRDPDGPIAAYLWNFGDGTLLTTREPRIIHTFASAGTYPFEVTAFDEHGHSSMLIRLLTVSNGLPGLVPSKKCGCQKMTVRATGNSKIEDPRRDKGKTAPLGKDPDFVSFNFEVEVELEPGSDAALCLEGQTAKGTYVIGDIVDHKTACTAGQPLTFCLADSDCSNSRCTAKPNELCNDFLAELACQDRGGECRSLKDGVCRRFPLTGKIRGNDGYQRPSDVKKHDPDAKIRWLDTPGLHQPQAAVASYLMASDFLMFIVGKNGGDCRCNVQTITNWNGRNYEKNTGITLMQTSENCSLVK